ncbi:MAG TPA: response regulator [Clostridia bacterium]|nr:response regulator [Clostridia bacterium]
MNRPTVLHIEDDPNDVLLFQHACRKAGRNLNVQSVGDGDEAIAYFTGKGRFENRETHPLPHLVLLDLKMPRINGFEVLAWLRKSEKLHRIPVVVLTSSNHEADVKRAYDLGANSYLVKPVGFEALVELVQVLEHYWLVLNERTDL